MQQNYQTMSSILGLMRELSGDDREHLAKQLPHIYEALSTGRIEDIVSACLSLSYAQDVERLLATRQHVEEEVCSSLPPTLIDSLSLSLQNKDEAFLAIFGKPKKDAVIAVLPDNREMHAVGRPSKNARRVRVESEEQAKAILGRS